jgi:hypothetical protein
MLVVGFACALIGAVVIVLCLSRPNEPEYQGKKLSWWVDGCPLYMRPALLRSEYPRGETADAMRAMGTNSIPYAVRWIATEPKPWHFVATYVVTNTAVPMFARRRLEPLAIGRINARSFKAGRALRFLGTNSAGAVQPIGKILESTGDRTTRMLAFSALCQIEEAGVNVSNAVPGVLLYDYVSRLNGELRPEDTHLNTLPTGHPFVSAVTNSLIHRDVRVRSEAIERVCWLAHSWRCEPEALRVCTNDSDAGVRTKACEALSKLERERREFQARTGK